MNEQNNNTNNNVKSKFFNQELLNDVNVSDVGSSTSGQVLSWGVGGKWNGNETLDSTQMFNFANDVDTEVEVLLEDNVHVNDNFVNSTFDGTQFSQAYNNQEVLNTNQQNSYASNVQEIFDTVKMNSSTNQVVSDEFVQGNPTFVGFNTSEFNNGQISNDSQNEFTEPKQVSNNTIKVPAFNPFGALAEPVQNVTPSFQAPPEVSNNEDLIMQQNSPLFMMAAESQNKNESVVNPVDFTTNDRIIDDNTRLNQPLSMMALSGETIDEAQRPRDVVEEGKFFQNTPLHDNRLNVNEVVAVPVPVEDVLKEPTRDLNVLELIKSFVGEKYQKISMSPFSFCGGLFGSLYFFFRKMYLYGLILAIINLVATIIMIRSIVLGLGLLIGEFIIVGLLTNSLYLNFANKQVRKIAIENPKMSQYELQTICAKKGGTSLLLAILINIVINSISSSILALVGAAAVISSLFSGQNILNSDKSVDINEIIEFVIPTEFVVDKKQNLTNVIYEEVKVKGEKKNIAACAFDINVISGYDTSYDLVRYMADTDRRYNKVNSYSTESGEKWDTYEFEGKDGMEIHRARMYDGHVVLVSYFINKYATEGMCELHLENIMNSIKEK